MNGDLEGLQRRIGHTFRDRALLLRALTHASWVQDNPGAEGNNQRLEFLGDSVLQLVLTEALYALFPEDREGELTKRRAVLGKGEFLSRLAREIGLDACLLLGANEEASGGRSRDAALEDAFEALVGAVNLDAGIEGARGVVLRVYGDLAARLGTLEGHANPKGRLQEIVQPLHGNQALRYEVMGTEGADHKREFEVAVFLLERKIGSGRGTSKKQAEEEAARSALEAMDAGPPGR
ncbi:MAG TPA: ribonuclease III [Opitutaceae bacterium]